MVEVDPGRQVEIRVHYIATVIRLRQLGRYFTFSIRTPRDLLNATHVNQGGLSFATDRDLDLDPASSLDLCVRGCPASEQINYQEYLAKRRLTPPASSSSISSSESKIHTTHQHAHRHHSSSHASSHDAKYRHDVTSSSTSSSSPRMARDVALRKCVKAGLTDFYLDSCVFDLMETGDEDFAVAALRALEDEVDFNPQAAAEAPGRTDLDAWDRKYGGGSSAAGSLHVTQSGRKISVFLAILTLLFLLLRCDR